MKSSFITEPQAFQSSLHEVESSMIVNAGMPEQVFRSAFRLFSFEEFDWAMSSAFWPLAQEMAMVSGDSSLLIAVLEPDPIDYFRREFGYYNWASLPVSRSSQEYWSLLNEHPADSPADSVLVNSKKVVWLPPSGKWAIWGERSYGVCVLGLRELMNIRSWHDVEWALDTCLPNCFRNQTVPPGFAALLRSNFKARA